MNIKLKTKDQQLKTRNSLWPLAISLWFELLKQNDLFAVKSTERSDGTLRLE
jgi:hypothetical protein